MTEPKPRRTYTSTRRKAQAQQTRQLIMETARRLFFERGYPATSLDAIAREAGVSVETIYASFGSKLNLLAKLVDFSVMGDEEPTPLLQRAQIQSSREVPDQRQLIAKFAMDIGGIMARMSPIFGLLRENAKTEPEIAAILQRMLQGRLEGMRFFTGLLARLGPLRPGLDPEQAAQTTWAISSAEVYHLLTVERGWSAEQYTRWLADSLERLLLE